jgi:hypothetical protein
VYDGKVLSDIINALKKVILYQKVPIIKI